MPAGCEDARPDPVRAGVLPCVRSAFGGAYLAVVCLLPAPRRTDGDHRRYGPANLDRLLFIRGAQRLGLRLAEIRELLAVRDTGVCACEPAERLLRRHLTDIDAEMARLAALRTDLSRMLDAMTGPGCPDPVPGTWCPPGLDGCDPEGGDHDVLMLRRS